MAREDFDGVSQQTKAGRERLKDAEELIAAEQWQGAMYMAGYAVECLLKSKLMRLYGCRHLRDLESVLISRNKVTPPTSIYTHNLSHLLSLCQASDRLRQSRELWLLFNLVNGWIPAWRYSPEGKNQKEAIIFMSAVDTIIEWIENNV